MVPVIQAARSPGLSTRLQGDTYIIENTRDTAPPFSLPLTLDCGQAFRFDQDHLGRWYGVAGDVLLCAQTVKERVEFYGVSADTAAFIDHYFDLSCDYAPLKELFCRRRPLRLAVEQFPGIRVLRQNAFEALCTFILSQNNNIARIKGLVQRLCQLTGQPFCSPLYPGRTFYRFPAPADLAGLEVSDLAPVRAGFRAKYLLDAARRVHAGQVDLERCRTLPIDEARQHLMQIYGVGPKVADCALLYGLYRTECVPMDVWMKRVMKELLPGGFPRYMRPYAGIAQQFLFHYARQNAALFKEKEPAAPAKDSLSIGG